MPNELHTEVQQEEPVGENETKRLSVLWQRNQSFTALPCIFPGFSARHFLQLTLHHGATQNVIFSTYITYNTWMFPGPIAV